MSASTCLVTVNRPGSAAASRAATARCQACGRAACDAPADASSANGASRSPRGPRPASSSAGRRRRTRRRWPAGTGSARAAPHSGPRVARPREPGRRPVSRSAACSSTAPRRAAPPRRPRRPRRTGRAAAARLGRPGQQLGVEQQPGGRQLVEQPGRRGGARTRSSSAAVSSGPKNGRPVRVQTAPAPMPGVDAEAGHRVGLRARNQHHGPRPMCFSSHTTSRTPASA